MKKRIILSALFIVILLLTACSESAAPTSADSMEGIYRLADAKGEDANDLLGLKDGVTLEVRGDNTAELSLMTDRHELVFDVGTMTCTSDSGDPVAYTFDGSRITMKSDFYTMVFEKE